MTLWEVQAKIVHVPDCPPSDHVRQPLSGDVGAGFRRWCERRSGKVREYVFASNYADTKLTTKKPPFGGFVVTP